MQMKDQNHKQAMEFQDLFVLSKKLYPRAGLLKFMYNKK